MGTDADSHQVRARIVERTADIVTALMDLTDVDLTSPSELPGWSRLTIACHLRYGAAALTNMTADTLRGHTASYYPGGRGRQRPGTLEPDDGEGPQDVVQSLAAHGARLSAAWDAVPPDRWHREVVEPSDNPDLGRIPLSRLPLLRLTEVEAHGSDLGVRLGDWSTTFVRATLPLRLEALNHRTPVDATIEGVWVLVATDGPTYRVSVINGVVESVPADRPVPARAVLETTSRDLLALLLGRPMRHVPRISGDRSFGEGFSVAFPGP